MTIHFLGEDSLFTACGLSVQGRDSIPVTKKKREVTCLMCKSGL